jgi:hypothetical protein
MCKFIFPNSTLTTDLNPDDSFGWEQESPPLLVAAYLDNVELAHLLLKGAKVLHAAQSGEMVDRAAARTRLGYGV